MFIIIMTAICSLLTLLTLTNIFKRLFDELNLRKSAKIKIGNEVSIHNDKGAKLAYKGIYSYLNNDPSKALAHFEKALKYSVVAHNNAFCLDWMSQCYDMQEKQSDSLACCIKAVEVEPSNIKALFNLADTYVRRGLFTKAEFYYNQILRYDNSNKAATFMLGTLYIGRGQYDKAEEQFLKALDIDEKFTAAMAELSVVMAIKGDYSKMEAYFTKAKVSKAKDGSFADHDRLRKRLNSIKKMRSLCNDY